MANTLANLIRTLLMPKALVVLREACVMPMLVYTDFKNEAAEKGGTIRIAKPQSFTAQTLDPATGSTSADLADDKVDITLANWKYVQFQMNDKEMMEALTSAVLPSAVDAGMKALANDVGNSLWALYKDIWNYYGPTIGVPNGADDIAGLRRTLQDQLVPPGGRSLALNTLAEEKFLVEFKDAEKTGTTQALREAVLGKLFGFYTLADQLAPDHTFGTLAGAGGGALATKANQSAGETSIVLDNGGVGTLTGTLKAGDLMTVAGQSLAYAVTADATAAGNEITFSIDPALRAGITDGDVWTLIKPDSGTSYGVSMGFHKEAFALAIRPLASADDLKSESSTIIVETDPVTGIPLRLETWRDSAKATRMWRFDILYGVKTLRTELASRFIGYAT